jgi:aspartate aminotransferase-like enzyme
MTDENFGTFFLPGPTEVRRDVLAAMTGPMIAHRGKEFETLYARIQVGLREVFRTTRHVFVSSSSATGLMEAGVRCAPPGPVLAIVNGAFSDRFAHIARNCARVTDVMDVAWGDVPNLDEVRRRIVNRRYVAITVAHSESSTGALTDVRALNALARENGTLCLVDSVTGIAATPLDFDQWHMDYVLTGSQKALALPPGLALGVASESYMRAAAKTTDRGLYFDLVEFEEYGKKNQTPNTPAIALLYALDVQLAHIVREGISQRWARHATMAIQTWEWVERSAQSIGIPLRVLAPAGSRSTAVTAVALPETIKGSDLVAAVRRRGFTIGAGYGKLRDTTFRIGHMGDHTPAGLARCLEACEDALKELQPVAGSR